MLLYIQLCNRLKHPDIDIKKEIYIGINSIRASVLQDKCTRVNLVILKKIGYLYKVKLLDLIKVYPIFLLGKL
jgi:hypothetical protein